MKIALVGGHLRTRLQAPFDDPSWEIWACAPKNRDVLPRVDAWFEIHSPEILSGVDWYGTDAGKLYLDWLATLPLVYMQEVSDDIPGSFAYPVTAMLSEFGRYFFRSTFAWMMALALSRDTDTIGLWGFEMATGTEHAEQRPGLHHFVQMARDWGIEIVVPEGSTVLDPPPLYGPWAV